jgi:hypothetical protein
LEFQVMATNAILPLTMFRLPKVQMRVGDNGEALVRHQTAGAFKKREARSVAQS